MTQPYFLLGSGYSCSGGGVFLGGSQSAGRPMFNALAFSSIRYSTMFALLLFSALETKSNSSKDLGDREKEVLSFWTAMYFVFDYVVTLCTCYVLKYLKATIFYGLWNGRGLLKLI